MEKLDLRGLEEILGIYSPWSIRSAKPNEAARTIDVHLEVGDRTRLFGLLVQGRTQNEGTLGSWQYVNLGRYRVMIHAPIANSGAQGTALNYTVFNQPCFLGSHDRRYSNLVRQQVASCQTKGFSREQIAEVLGLPLQLVASVLEDLGSVSTQLQSLACLPTELDPVWENLLRGDILLETQMLPLKLLLNKLQLTAKGARRGLDLLPSAMELRKFFIANASILGGEIAQIFGGKMQPTAKPQQAGEAVTKLVLPGLINPVWQELLSGRLQLSSASVPLNLLISKQRMVYQRAEHSKDKLGAVEVVRDYFHKNYRTLKAELLLLNRACAIHEKTKYRLPDADHSIWQQILQDDEYIPSSHVAYKLLLTRLRSQLRLESSDTSRLDAARRIREFIKQNHKSMKQELVYLIKQTTTAA